MIGEFTPLIDDCEMGWVMHAWSTGEWATSRPKSTNGRARGQRGIARQSGRFLRQLSHVLSAGPHTVKTMRERETRTIQERRERREGREGR